MIFQYYMQYHASLEDLFIDLWGDDSTSESTAVETSAFKAPETAEDHTLMSDKDFLEGTIRQLAQTHSVHCIIRKRLTFDGPAM